MAVCWLGESDLDVSGNRRGDIEQGLSHLGGDRLHHTVELKMWSVR